jgi:subtilase family serine protease
MRFSRTVLAVESCRKGSLMRQLRVIAFAVFALAGCAGPAALPLAQPPGSSQIPPGMLAQLVDEASAPVRFDVALPLRNQGDLNALFERVSDPDSQSFRHFISRAAFLERFAPTAADRVAVARELQAYGFRVQVMDQAVKAAGTLAQAERYFRAPIRLHSYDNGPAYAADRELTLSPLLASKHAVIIGLAGIPPMRTFSKFGTNLRLTPDSRSGSYGPYFAADLRQAYQYPSYQEAAGHGVRIGIVIDSPVLASDIDTYFKSERLHAPSVTEHPVDGGGRIGPDTGEATLDVEQSLGTAPGASAAVFNVPSLSITDIYDAYSAVVAEGTIDIVNSSWGECELVFDSSSGISALKTFDNLFYEGLTAGTTFVAASGDSAAYSCGLNDNEQGVSWPAVSPYVLGVGGTNLTTTYAKGSYDSAYRHEDEFAEPLGGGAFWGSGGGYSQLYLRPSYQNGFVSDKGRGVPDMAGEMGGEGFSSDGSHCQALKCNVDDSSDWLRLQGKWTQAIGTSASSPDTVGLLAVTAQIIKSRLGFVNGELYKAATKRGVYFHSGIKGDNGFETTRGLWDPVLGVGTPIGYRIAGAKSPAGTPRSASNP